MNPLVAAGIAFVSACTSSMLVMVAGKVIDRMRADVLKQGQQGEALAVLTLQIQTLKGSVDKASDNAAKNAELIVMMQHQVSLLNSTVDGLQVSLQNMPCRSDTVRVIRSKSMESMRGGSGTRG